MKNDKIKLIVYISYLKMNINERDRNFLNKLYNLKYINKKEYEKLDNKLIEFLNMLTDLEPKDIFIEKENEGREKNDL